MRHPFVIALAAGLAVLLAAAAAVGWQMWRGPAPAAGAAVEQGLPWQQTPEGGGALATFDLTPGVTTLSQAAQRLGDSVQVAVVGRIDEPGALEAMVEPYRAGFLTGRLVLAFDAAPEALARWRSAATGSEPMDGGVRRFSLRAADREAASATVLSGMSFVPSVRLDETVVRQRFGEPAAVLRLGASAQAWLYPTRGLAVTLDAKGRDVLNYVAPAAFETRLAAPLKATAASSAER